MMPKYPDMTIIKGLVPNASVIDTFTAPDSMAARPNPASLEDRPRKPFNEPATTLEYNLNDDEESES